MLQYITGDLLLSDAEALVNTVNTVGIMGKGIALQFKNTFPDNYKRYVKACKEKTFSIGQLLVTDDDSSLHSGKKIIINFPTKTDWRKPSEYSYIESGLKELVTLIKEKKIRSIAIPPLGAGNGGLEWIKVKHLIDQYLSNVNCDVFVYQPNFIIQEVLKKERVKLTPARAMLLSVLFDLVKNGEFVSEFAAEKVAYFLQRFGAEKILNLEFQPNFYGPYSSKVKHVLYHLNGSYVTGYGAKDKKPFEEIGLMMDAEKEVELYLCKPEHKEYLQIVAKTKNLLTGFYSYFGLELLSTVDYIMQTEGIYSQEAIQTRLNTWSERKKTLFSDQKFLTLALQNLQKNNLYS